MLIKKTCNLTFIQCVAKKNYTKKGCTEIAAPKKRRKIYSLNTGVPCSQETWIQFSCEVVLNVVFTASLLNIQHE